MSKLLFVDDDAFMLKSLRRSLRSLDFDCYFAINGYEAIQVIHENNIDVILTDMKMPEMNGLELLKEIDKIDNSIVKIVISGSIHMQELIETVNEVDIFKYISKPYEVYLDLIPILKEALAYSKFKKSERLKEKALLSINAEYRATLNQLNSDINTNEVGLNILKIYNHLFIEALHKQVDEKSSVDERKRFYNSYECFLTDFFDEMDSKNPYFKVKLLQAELESMVDKTESSVNCHVASSLIHDRYAEGISSYIKPMVLNIMRDILLNKPEDHFDIHMTDEKINDNRSNFVCKLTSKSNGFSDLVHQSHYDLYKNILETFGDELVCEQSGGQTNIVIKVRLYKLE